MPSIAALGKCPLCGHEEFTPRFQERQHHLRTCTKCDLSSIHPYPDLTHATERVVDDSFEELTILDGERNPVAEERFYQRYFSHIAGELGDPTSILDVGCGTGRFLELAGAVFPRARRCGIELNPARATVARTRARCEISTTPVEFFEDASKFDAITVVNVISHIPIRYLLDALRRLLAPAGRVLIVTGEVTLDARKSDLHDWGIPGHLQFFGPRTIDVVCQEYGFELGAPARRTPLSDVYFDPTIWQTRGRSFGRNAAKAVLARIPGARSLARGLYRARHGSRICSAEYLLRAES